MEKEDISKRWDWTKVENKLPWLTPAPEAYYLASRWKKDNKKSFLDFGCGLGRHSFFFASNGFDVKAFDLSIDSVNEVKKKSKELGFDIQVIESDMHHVSYEDESFDCLLAYHVISHTNFTKIHLVAKEMYRLLRSGGEAYFDLCAIDGWMFKESNYPKIDERTVVVNEEGPEYGIPHLCVSLDDILSIFKMFTIVSVEHRDICYEEGKKKNQAHYWVLLRK